MSKQAEHLAKLHEQQQQDALVTLRESDAKLLEWRAAGLSFATIGKLRGVSRARAHQLVADAVRRQKLRHQHGSKAR